MLRIESHGKSSKYFLMSFLGVVNFWCDFLEEKKWVIICHNINTYKTILSETEIFANIKSMHTLVNLIYSAIEHHMIATELSKI